MITDMSNVEGFYQQQNIKIRKEIRQMDLQIKDLLYNSKLTNTERQEIFSKLNVNFLVIGPSKSGKTSLLKTMHFALNSNINPEISISQLPGTVVKKFEIKKSKKYQIEGLTKVKQSDQKKSVSCIEFEDKIEYSGKLDEKSSKVFQKYSNALQMIDNRIFGCFKLTPIKQAESSKSQSQHSSIANVKTVLIVLNIIGKIQFQEMSCLKFFLNDVREKGIKVLIILTHVDKLSQLNEKDKLRIIEERIEMLSKELDFKNRDDFICIENYHELSTNTGHKILHQYHSPEPSQQSQIPSMIHSLNQNRKQSQQQKNKYLYKKVSQLSSLDETFRMEVPVISKQHFFNPIVDQQKYSLIQDKNDSLSMKLTQNSAFNYPLAKVSTKTLTSQNTGTTFETQNSSIKKFSLQNHQSSSLNYHPYQATFKNSEEINFYSLKLLMRILQESQKYTQTEFKHKKIIKWFCG